MMASIKSALSAEILLTTATPVKMLKRALLVSISSILIREIGSVRDVMKIVNSVVRTISVLSAQNPTISKTTNASASTTATQSSTV